MQRHTGTTSHLENKEGEAFQWRPGGWEAEACTSLEILLRYFRGCVQCLASSVWFLLRIRLHVGLRFS
jgi:hypothetical protein